MPLLKKLLLIVLVVLIYFLGIRKLRSIIHDSHLGTILPETYGMVEDNPNLSFFSHSSVSFTFFYQSEERDYTLEYKISFGVFFLLSMIGLISIGASRNEFLMLLGVHFVSGLLSFLFLLAGINIQQYFLIIPDLFSRYLVPLCSLGLVGLVYLRKQRAIE